MAIKDIDFFTNDEVEILLRCKQLLERFLQEEYRLMEYLEDRGKSTKISEVKVVQMEYALGIRKERPNLKRIYEGS